ncbi:IclR family transcriptional regulator [Actinomadura graeca]|uniref:IclR family transcriptional regulator n=1 Tax=Actinomadura graeca TaxID=2750812 RepID=UPI001E41D2DE|nr:IclR family transcriptional regulator [Actinomadura graeca]
MAEDVGESSTPSVLEKVALVLNAFEGPRSTLGLTDVVRHTGLAQSTVHRLMDQLVKIGWLGREGRRYFLGLRLLELGAFASHHNRIRRAALPHLIALHQETGHWAHLSVLDKAEVVYLEQIGNPRHSAIPYQVGARLPAHCTASGKALLAYGDATVEALLRQDFTPRTRQTIVRGDYLRSELATVRETGVAFDREECFSGVTCAAAPLRGAGRAVAAISLSRTAGYADLPRMANQVSRCARAVWASLFESGRRFAQADKDREPAPASDTDTVLSWLGYMDWS